jgi:hypothetical protein
MNQSFNQITNQKESSLYQLSCKRGQPANICPLFQNGSQVNISRQVGARGKAAVELWSVKLFTHLPFSAEIKNILSSILHISSLRNA